MTPLYLHGLPGSGRERDLACRPDLAVLDRDAPSFAQLANRLPPGPLHLVGFSLGAAAALRLAALRPDAVARLTLISAAAPLELGDFLPRMAGAAVFRAARSHGQLAAMTKVQSVLMRLSPGLVVRMLLRDCGPADAAFFAEPGRRALLSQIVRDGLTRGRAVYLRELPAYVQPWSGHLAHVRCPVTLWHGSDDRWAPVDMAEALATRLPRAELNRCDGLGHYTTLALVLPTL